MRCSTWEHLCKRTSAAPLLPGGDLPQSRAGWPARCPTQVGSTKICRAANQKQREGASEFQKPLTQIMTS